MSQFIDLLEKKGIKLPQNVVEVLENCAGYTVYNTVDELHVVTPKATTTSGLYL
jgi:hypothetical protein